MADTKDEPKGATDVAPRPGGLYHTKDGTPHDAQGREIVEQEAVTQPADAPMAAVPSGDAAKPAGAMNGKK